MESLNHSASSFVNIFVALGSLWNLVKLKGHEPALFPTELGIRASFPGSAVKMHSHEHQYFPAELGIGNSFPGSSMYQKIAAGMAAIQQMQRARGKQKRQRRIENIETLETLLEQRKIVPVKELFDALTKAEKVVYATEEDTVGDEELKFANATLCMRG
jgi:hypothetical protein